LGRHLALGTEPGLQAAAGLGHQAAALGLETLDLAVIHEQALRALRPPDAAPGIRRNGLERAKAFFAEALVPIEKTHHAARQDDVRARRLARTLLRRTAESSASTRQLAQSVVRRQAAEAALRKSGRHRAKLLQESARLRARLQDATRAMLAAREDAMRKTSRELRDEIAQALLAVHVRLLTWKKAVHSNTKKMGMEIAETQRLVRQSVKTMRRLAHEFGSEE
jgi:two-component system, NarL family, sensor histidine kinase DegS